MAAARVMMRPCDLLILDEPTASMDMQSTALTERLIQDFRRETGCAVLLITHSLGQAGRLADRILFLTGGPLAEEGERNKCSAPKTPGHPRVSGFLRGMTIAGPGLPPPARRLPRTPRPAALRPGRGVRLLRTVNRRN